MRSSRNLDGAPELSQAGDTNQPHCLIFSFKITFVSFVRGAHPAPGGELAPRSSLINVGCSSSHLRDDTPQSHHSEASTLNVSAKSLLVCCRVCLGLPVIQVPIRHTSFSVIPRAFSSASNLLCKPASADSVIFHPVAMSAVTSVVSGSLRPCRL